MKIEYIEGNLFNAPEKYLLHGCNAQGVMGSGVAKIVRNLYPLAYYKYKEFIDATDYSRVGEINVVDCGTKTIINAITQEFYGRDGKRYVSYDALDKIFYELNYILPKGAKLAMPKVGSSLGGGNWDIISTIIDSNAKNYTPIVYIY